MTSELILFDFDETPMLCSKIGIFTGLVKKESVLLIAFLLMDLIWDGIKFTALS